MLTPCRHVFLRKLARGRVEGGRICRAAAVDLLDFLRCRSIGHSAAQRLVIVSFTERGQRTRIIGAREATARERDDYEQKRQKNSQPDVSSMRARVRIRLLTRQAEPICLADGPARRGSCPRTRRSLGIQLRRESERAAAIDPRGTRLMRPWIRAPRNT